MDRRHSAAAPASHDPGASVISLPSRRSSPLGSVASRAALALGLLVLSTIIVYLGRYGYKDTAEPGQPLNLVACMYYATVTLSTTGYGDIVPVTTAARLVNTLIITPIRVVFLIVLIGTTIEVLAERTRLNWRISRWRQGVSGHTVVVGYGTKGRSALETLREAGTPPDKLVVVDCSAAAMAAANQAGLAGVTGDATRRQVLASAEIGRAARLVIAVGRDDTAVLIALTGRQLSDEVTIVASVRESENEPLLRQSGADQVVVSSDAAGRLLGLSATDAGIGRVLAELLDPGRGLALTERRAVASEVGLPLREAAAGAVALLRGEHLLAADDPRAGRLRDGDSIVLVAAAGHPSARR